MRADPLLDELARTRYGRLVAFAAMVGGSSASAPDLVHDAMIAVFGRRRSFPSLDAADAYVRRAITTRHLDGQRKRARRRDREVRYARRVPRAHEDPAPLDSELIVALNELGPQARVAVVLRYLEDRSVHETAQIMGLADGTVKRYVSDGLAALNARLGTSEELSDVEKVDVRRGGAR